MKTRWRLLFRVWLFAFAAVASAALFYPREPARAWMHGRVVVVNADHTFGFQPEGKDFWYTVHEKDGDGMGWGVGQKVNVQPIAFEGDGVMRARVR